MTPDAAKAAHTAQAMGLILAAAQTPGTTQPSAGVGVNPAPVVAESARGTSQRQGTGPE